MSKLLTANFMRLKKSKLFWIISAFTAVINYFGLVDAYDMNKKLANWHAGMEDSAFEPTTAMHVLYSLTPILGLLAALMIAIFIGTEYHDNTMRNKLICGQPRGRVYLANLLTCIFIAVLFYLIPVVITLAVGIPLLGVPHVTPASLLQLLLFGIIGLLLSTVYASLCTLIGMLVHNRSFSLLTAILLTFGFLICGMFCSSRLEEPEYYFDYEFIFMEDGSHPSEPLKNPHYLEGNARLLVQFLYDFLPSGQAIQISNLDVAHPYRLLLYSLGITGASTLTGLTFFKKKDLK
ncbi:MAG: ABC transporter permease [Lachnospiraceae bacterium]|nr:ABC transporter permease [Lachnospiraceae bacterium]